jgi:pyrimidine-specific ribonucleoside hydrolase
MLRKRSIVVFILCAASIFCLFRFLSAHVEPGLSPRETVCLKEFPEDPSLFKEEVQPYVKKIIERHGDEEWKACLLTNELHRHLGMLSIVGAKMGVRAREILEVPFDELEVISFAGYTQPLSCLNDGIQVSTGASLGRGSITVGQFNQPVAIFVYKDKKVTLKIKPEVMKEIGDIVKDYSKKYTFQSPKYFQELDKVSIETWMKWDRKKIFEEKVG